MTMNYKDTLNLPRTDFAMKANLVERERQRLQKWDGDKLYQQIQAARAGAREFVLHDGPPFANGSVHIGTALNKILKDIIIKYKTLRGSSAPYVPGWDCHGLPIEYKVMQDIRADELVALTRDKVIKENLKEPLKFRTQPDEPPFKKEPLEIRKLCENEARQWIESQKLWFERLGVLGDWENPYLTLDKTYEADELRLFADIVQKGFVYRGKKPVYWCIRCRTALAEAEVEYQDHVSQSVYVKFKVVQTPAAVQASQSPIESNDQTFVLIWTTTPWTLPANLAVALNPKLQYSLVHVGEEKYWLLSSLLPVVAEKCKWDKFETLGSVLGHELEGLKYEHPFCKRFGEAFAAEFVTSDTGTGFVHIAPGHGLDDYNLGRQKNLQIYSPVDDDGRLCRVTPERPNDLSIEQQMPDEMVGKSIRERHGRSDANEAVLALLRAKRALLHDPADYHHSYPHCWRSKTPIIFRAMDQWFIKIDAPTLFSLDVSKARSFRQDAVAEIDRVQWIPDWGVNRIKGAVQSRPDWCISRQRSWGVPLPAFYDADGGPILDKAVILNVADLIQKEGSNIWFEKSATELWEKVKPNDWKGAEAVTKSKDTLDVWIDSGSSSRAVLMNPRYKLLKEPRNAKERAEFEAAKAEKKEWDGAWQADVYLEGSDQHRGWFQSSLLLSLAGNGAAPFKTVLTHGFMVDADRDKISKSKQETPPEFVPAGSNHSAYFLVGQSALESFKNHLTERSIQIGQPEEHIELSKIQYFALYLKKDISVEEANKLIAGFNSKPKSGYEKPQTAEAYVNKYGADVVRLWVASQDFRNDIVVSEERVNKVGETYRAIRNALRYQLSNLYDFNPAQQTIADDKLTGLDRWILHEFSKLEAEVITAYDQYEFHVVYQKVSQFIAVELSSIYHDAIKDRLYTDAADSSRRRSTQTALYRLVRGLCAMLSPMLVFTADEAWEFIPDNGGASVHLSTWEPRPFTLTEREEQTWKRLFEIRPAALACLEKERQAKSIGKALDAKIILKGPPQVLGDLTDKEKESLRELLNVSQLSMTPQPEGSELTVEAVKADGQKCERCWHWETDVGANAEHPLLCGRCVAAVRHGVT
jgi:isoleucyl-tRNA synthetase